jgi:hypothetical protein
MSSSIASGWHEEVTRRLTCALLTRYRNDWAATLLMMCPGLSFVSLSPATLGVDGSPNPFALPEGDDADVILVTSYWYQWLVGNRSHCSEAVMRRLERHRAVMIGIDGADYFELSLPPAAIERMRVVLKFQGLFKDRDLYNYDVGPWYPGALWAMKSRPKQSSYSAEHLEKLRLSVPCLLLDVLGARRHMRRYERGATRLGRREIGPAGRLGRGAADAVFERLLRAAASSGHRPLDVHCITTLTHVQRLEVMRLLDGFSGHRGIDAIPRSIAGLYGPGVAIPDEVLDEIAAEARAYEQPRLSRTAYLRDLTRHKIGVAPTGYGEVGQRHGATLLAGAALICQDLSHVEMMFSFREWENCVFCRPDLSDLRERVTDLLTQSDMREAIAREGLRSYREWAAGWRDLLRDGIEAHLLAATH